MIRFRTLWMIATALGTLVGCSSRAPLPPIFHDSPAIDVVRDNAPIPMPPERTYHRISYLYDVHGWRQARDMLQLDSYGPALDVNRFGEVPESSWYAGQSNFIPSSDPGPEAFRPWQTTGLKVGGRNPGFVFQDTRCLHQEFTGRKTSAHRCRHRPDARRHSRC